MPGAQQSGRYRVTFYLTADQDRADLSHVLSGLVGLHSRNWLSFTLTVPAREEKELWGETHLAAMTVRECDSGQTRLLALDLYDRSDVWRMELLQRADVYLKRSYFPADVEGLPSPLRAKVVPFGLNYACRTARSTAWTLARLGPSYTARLWRALSHGRAALRDESEIYRKYLSTPEAMDFELAPQVELKRSVLFQTRVWEPGSASEDVGPLNEARVALVRALQKEFGGRFVGGIVPTPYAMKRYPDLITRNPCRRGQYLAFSKRYLVGVCSRGLDHSLPFKLPEYLAASKCIVSEPLRNTLPAPLVAGRDYLEFRTVEECVRQCARVFEHPQLEKQLRSGSWEYYRREVEPEAHMARCIERALAWTSRRNDKRSAWHAAVQPTR